MNRTWLRLVILTCVLATSPLSHAGYDGEWGPCDDLEPKFPEAAEFLQSLGFPPDEFTVLLTWRETTRRDPRQLITGYHILPVGATETFDLYSDSQGNVLDEERLAAMGIPPKNWNLPPIERLGEAPKALAKALPPRPTPVGPLKSVSPPALVCLFLPDGSG